MTNPVPKEVLELITRLRPDMRVTVQEVKTGRRIVGDITHVAKTFFYVKFENDRVVGAHFNYSGHSIDREYFVINIL